MGGFGAGPCVHDDAYITAAKEQASAIKKSGAVDIAIEVGTALWQRNASQSIANMQDDLADQQIQLAEEIHAHMLLFWPEETELVNDVFAESKVSADYNGLPLIFGTIADETNEQARAVWIDTMRTLCMAPSRCEDARWQRFAIMGEVDFQSYGARQEEAREQILNDRRFGRQLGILGMGKGLLRSVSTYQSVSQYAGMSAGEILESGVNTALGVYGYSRRKQDEAHGWGVGLHKNWLEAQTPTLENTPTMPGTVGWRGDQLPGLQEQNLSVDFDAGWRNA